MKKLYIIILLGFSSFGFSQTFYSENMGTPATTTLITAYTGWQNSSPIIYTGSGDVRTSAASTGYTGASGSGNVFLTNTAGRFLQIDGINSSAYAAGDIQLSFGYLTNNIGTQLVVEQSTDGTTWTPITFSQNPNTSWHLVTIPGGQIPSSTTLSLRFTQPATAQMRIDDIRLTNISASCVLALSGETVACVASTLSLDDYTVTIPYTGGGTASYTITTSGTVSGDNPSSVAAGNIIVTFVENTAYAINITGGTCNYDVTGNSPECKPINTLPYNEPFPYTVGNSLNAEQKWTVVNSGDNILVETGNLSYTGITSTGNSVSFIGAGAESLTPFTNVTSGAIYASFLARVTDLSAITVDLTSNYYALFTTNAGAFTNARIWMRKNGTQYQYGLGTAASPTDWDSTLYDANTTQYLVLGYDYTANTLSLFINPVIGASGVTPTISVTMASPITNIGGFMLRQDAANTTPGMIVDELTIDTNPNFTLSSSSFNAIDGLTMYPNPLKGNTLYLTSTANAIMTVQIFDVLGKEVLKSNVINNTVNVSGLNAGVYIVKITEEGKTATRKLVIQ
jgi:hypothetical protein